MSWLGKPGPWVQIPASPFAFSDKENANGTKASVKRPDKGRSERGAFKVFSGQRKKPRHQSSIALGAV